MSSYLAPTYIIVLAEDAVRSAIADYQKKKLAAAANKDKKD